MKKNKIVAVKVSKGEFNGMSYDNVIIYTVSNPVSDAWFGCTIESVKVNHNVFDQCYSDSYSTLIDKFIKVAYNRYGKVEDFEVFDK